VWRGTDVTKEASDMVLTNDSFNSLVNAVEEGRGIFDAANLARARTGKLIRSWWVRRVGHPGVAPA